LGATRFSHQDQPVVSVDPVLIERVAQLDVAQQLGIVPVVVASTRPNLNAIIEMVFGDQQHTLDRKVLGPEACLAITAVPAILDIAYLLECPNDLKSFIAAVAIASPMLD
jgi:hypothetical protein